MTRKILTIAVLIVMNTALARAEGRVLLGGGVGYSAPGSGEFNDFAESGWSVSGHAAGAIRGSIGWRVSASHNSFRLDDDFEDFCDRNGMSCDEPAVTHANAGLQLGGFGEGDVVPYLFVSGGAYSVDLGNDFFDDSTEFGMSFGSGVNYGLTEKFGIGLHVAVHTVFLGDFEGRDVDNLTYYDTSLSLVYKF